MPEHANNVINANLPPQSVEAEQAVLGGLMIDNDKWDDVIEIIGASDFYREEHRLIFETIAELMEASTPLDVVTVSERMEAKGTLDNAGGLSYLGSIANGTPSAANIIAYAKIVKDRANRRALREVGSRIVELAAGDGKADELVNTAQAMVMEIGEGRVQDGPVTIKEVLVKVVDQIDQRFHNQGKLLGLSTGFKDLDDMLCGLVPSDLVILAGRPSMGKTALAMDIVLNAAITNKMRSLVFSLEMSSEQLGSRFVSSLGCINSQRIRAGSLNDEDWPRVMSTFTALSDAPIQIDDSPGITIEMMRSRARKMKRKHGLDLIVVDYLQLMQSGKSGSTRVAELSAITRGLKLMAKEFNVPVLCLSQLSREVEKRPNKRPVMADLRDSGSIEQDADVILFVYRDEAYNEDSPDKGTAEIIIGKQRNGPIGKVRLTFLGEYTKFENLDPWRL